MAWRLTPVCGERTRGGGGYCTTPRLTPVCGERTVAKLHERHKVLRLTPVCGERTAVLPGGPGGWTANPRVWGTHT
jgi:hypothetical protein